MIRALGEWIVVGFVVCAFTGCGGSGSGNDGSEQTEGREVAVGEPEPLEDSPPPPEPTPLPDPQQVPPDLAGVQWLHTDVSSWEETATLDVSVADGFINLNYDKATVWPARNGVNANPWIFVFQDGRWYAATWEWLGFGQTRKPTSTVNGPHIGRAPLQNFNPRSGEWYGFMVSGLARDSTTRNVSERTPVVMLQWP
jgi:hypothetical protein